MNLKKLISGLNDRLQLERAQTMSEYALVLTLISGSTVLVFTGLASKVATMLTDVVGLLP
jgi:Flp pilus assembly pilin Flp